MKHLVILSGQSPDYARWDDLSGLKQTGSLIIKGPRDCLIVITYIGIDVCSVLLQVFTVLFGINHCIQQ